MSSNPNLKRFLAFFGNPYLLAFLFSVVIVPFTEFNIRKDAFSIERTYYFGNKNTIAEDLNGDGESEVLRIGNHREYQLYLEVRTLDNKVHDQWNGLYAQVPKAPVYCGDYDMDGLKEVYLFSYKKDSVYLNVVEFFDDQGYEAKGIPVDHVPLLTDTIGCNIVFAGELDADKDGMNEIYFAIHNGFSIFPRKLYSFSPVTNKVSSSIDYGVMYKRLPDLADVTGDGIPEIFGATSAVNNISADIKVPYPDSSAWLLVFNSDLTPLFPAIEYEKPLSLLWGKPFYSKKDTFILAFFDNIGVHPQNTPRIDVYSPRGELLNQINLQAYGERIYTIWQGNKNFSSLYFQMIEPSDVYELKSDFTIRKCLELEKPEYFINFQMYNNDYFLAASKFKNTYTLYNERLEKTGELPFHADDFIINLQGVNLSDSKKQHLLLHQSDGTAYLLSYHPNEIDQISVGKMFALYVILLGFIFFGQWIYKNQAEQRQQTLMQLTRFQMLSIKNQLDPHFTFNAVNTLGSLIYSDEKQKAYEYLLRFSNLLRSQLISSDKLLIPLKEELKSAQDYLELQKMRFGDKLDYAIKREEGLSVDFLVPRLCIHTYVENAIKHGIKHKEYGGRVEVSISNHRKNLLIEITDDGVGRREAAEKNTFSTGKGIESMEKLYTYINQYSLESITIAFIDLKDDAKQATGTLVRLMIPTTLKEEK